MSRSGIPATPAQLCLIGSLPRSAAEPPPRVRLVGRVASLIPESSLAVLVDTTTTAGASAASSSSSSSSSSIVTGSAKPTTAAVLIDLSLPVLGSGQPPPRLKDLIMITGQVTRLTEPVSPVPTLPVTLRVPIRNPLDLRTVIAVERFDPCENLDLEQWHAAVRAVHAARDWSAVP
ncbi:hypothetical protein JCM3774_005501 [Rhodotorula dairenensis]